MKGPDIIRIRTERDKYNKKIYSENITLSTWRIQALSANDQELEGGQTMAEFRIFLGPEVDIKRSDRLEFAGREFQILKFYPALDGIGILHHYEIDV